MSSSPAPWHTWTDARCIERVETARAHWQRIDGTRRLLQKDGSLWTDSGEQDWLGWLNLASAAPSPELRALAARVAGEGIAQVVLLGMGGSSLAAEVLAQALPTAPNSPSFTVLDSTDPGEILHVQRRHDLDRTLFIVASKSGSTLETHLLHTYFEALLIQRMGATRARQRFVVVTDPDSELDRMARSRGYLACFHGKPDVGGRFSALSNFGLVPAALMGADVARLLEGAKTMLDVSAPGAGRLDQAVELGLAMGALARAGRDKLTLHVQPPLSGLGDWIEQLVAESTGKSGVGIIPVVGEPAAEASAYGEDRLFVHIGLANDDRASAWLKSLRAAGHPVISLNVADVSDVGAELLRWELATAVAGAVLGIHPFDQPDVEAAKVAAREVLQRAEAGPEVPAAPELMHADDLRWSACDEYADQLRTLAEDSSVDARLRAHFGQAQVGHGYVALLAFLPRTPGCIDVLRRLQGFLQDRLRCAVTVGFGPRYLHSTGQAHKGGPAGGVFLQITGEHSEDVPIPEQPHGFAFIEAAQALGDMNVLAKRGRPILGVNVGTDHEGGLERLVATITRAVTPQP